MVENLVCNGCGASLPLPDDKGHVICPSCGRAQIIASEATPKPPPAPAAPTINVDLSGLANVARPAAKASAIGCALGPVFVLVVLGIVGAASFFAFRGSTSSISKAFQTPSSLSPNGNDAIMVPGEGADANDVLTMAYDSKANARRLVRVSLDGADGDPVWQSKDFDADVYSVSMRVVGGTVFVAGGDSLRALNLATGVERWRAVLPDKVKGCDSCFAGSGDGLVLLTDDGTVSAYGTDAAQPRWTRPTLASTPHLVVSGTNVAIVDQVVDRPFEASIVTLDATTGTVRSTTAPGCSAEGPGSMLDGIDPGSAVRFVAGSTDLVAIDPGGCASRWDSATGAVRWTTRFAAESGPQGDVLVAGANAFVPMYRSGIVRIDLNTGASTSLPTMANADQAPHSVFGNLLLVDTQTNKGTTKYGLAAYDLTSNTKRWEVLLPKGSQPPSENGNDALFPGSLRSVLLSGGDNLALMTFEGGEDGPTVTVQALDQDNGSLSATSPRSLGKSSGTASISILAVQPDRVVVSVEQQIQSIPVDGGDPILHWPR